MDRPRGGRILCRAKFQADEINEIRRVRKPLNGPRLQQIACYSLNSATVQARNELSIAKSAHRYHLELMARNVGGSLHQVCQTRAHLSARTQNEERAGDGPDELHQHKPRLRDTLLASFCGIDMRH